MTDESRQLRHDLAERVPPVQVVGPVGADDGDALAAQHPRQERDQLAGRRVGPVQVLKHEQHRVRRGEFGQRAEHRAEHLLPGHASRVGARRRLAAVRQQPGQHRPGLDDLLDLRRGGTERVRERQVGHAVADLGALAAQDREAVALGDRHHLGHQAGLAHAGVAADERGLGAPGRGVAEQPAEPRHLGVTAYQRCQRHSSLTGTIGKTQR